MNQQFSIQQLTKDDWEILRAIRLEALSREPQSFGSDYKKEYLYDKFHWHQFIGNEEDRVIFVIKHGLEIIGLTGATRSQEHPDEARLIASYLRKEYRGLGLSKMLYEARLDWAMHRKFSALVVSHRESNLASKMANQKFNFEYVYRREKVWPDGNSEDEIHYRLSLR